MYSDSVFHASKVVIRHMKVFLVVLAWIILSITLTVPYSTAFPIGSTNARDLNCKWIPESRRELPQKDTRSLPKIILHALTERQMQFWEDVEKGLDPIEQYYLDKSGQNITRVRTFTKRAQGLLPKPNPVRVGHQPSEEHIDGLTAQPYWGETVSEYNQFPWVARLEEQSSIIRSELENKLLATMTEQQQQASLFRGDSAWQSQVMGSGWSAIRLQRMGVWNVEFCEKHFPQTYHIVRSLNIPLAIRGVCFARQEGMSGVAPHSDGRNFILTAHLGLKIPTGCWIKVGEDDDTRNFVSRRGWEEGKIILLDTSFEHSTGNPTAEDRHVLIIDFWHPELSEAEKAALSFIYDLRNQFESGKIPFRMPESMKKQKQSQGLFASIWDSFTAQDIS